MEIVHYPDPTLRRRAAPVEEIGGGLRERVRGMFELMYEAGGVGLAAPQVGWSVQLCVINPTPSERSAELVCVNPLLADPEGSEVAGEGCLSLPEVRGNVGRWRRVRVRWYDLAGHRMEQVAEGLLARIFQHEIDHLEGRLIIDRMTPASRLSVRGALKDLERDYKARSRAGSSAR